MNARDKAVRIADVADAMKATKIRILHVTVVCNFTDYFVLMSCAATTQVRAVSEKIRREIRAEGERPQHVASPQNATWIAQDYGDVVVHIFTPDTRSYYDLDHLWSDAPIIKN